ncbi:protein-glutamine gamma-glutamyltransferase E-like [Halichoeres trimaculatus]|uniref:protein-glutamine gamma-glutamyltransferase E-like n=1 Tax=Halichoeres trimaculatus TaxID=147232 RepID=UPI003D9E4E85
MTDTSVFKDVDLHCDTNNAAHHTSDVSEKVLLVRRGQPFTITVTLDEPFKNAAQPLFIRVNIGEGATEEMGTLSLISVPDGVSRSPKAKAVWKVELDRKSSPYTGVLVLNITPPADAPIGQFYLTAKYGDAEKVLAEPTVLYNPWCPEDAVYMRDEKERQEYVMNEHGKVYRGSTDYIMPMDWDFGQFEENMVDVCLSLLRVSNEHQENQAQDLANRADPGYVGRLISAMINSEGDYGVVEGRWGGSFSDGRYPSHWTGSSALLTQWLNSGFQPVKYGQCWVFAAVMCSVMRFLGIPCRVITNFNSAHDTNANLTIDVFTAERGAMTVDTTDSVWNFHVWVEGYMKRPDLGEDGKYDGWQVLDPTPQELSDNSFRCGPASKVAILNGISNVDYDIPFVYAEVNADINVWLSKVDYSLEKVETNNTHVGKNISTKAVGTDLRDDITGTYKYREGSFLERRTFVRALILNYEMLRKQREEERRERESGNMASSAMVRTAETEEGGEAIIRPAAERTAMDGGTAEMSPAPPSMARSGTLALDAVATARPEEPAEDIPPPPRVDLKFEEVTKPMNGKDVEMNLVLSSASTTDRPLFVILEANTMTYIGLRTKQIMRKATSETLKPGLPLVIPVKIPFSDYSKPMRDSDSLKISALVMDQVNSHHPYMKECNVVLQDPPLSVTLKGEARVNQPTTVELVFENPVKETLKNCTVTISGSGLERGEYETPLKDIRPNIRIRVRVIIIPYKVGRKTLTVDFDCSVFRDIKSSCTIDVKP